MEKKIVIILTMSSKHHGYCVAGIDISNRKWVRLVSNNSDNYGALNKNNIICKNGEKCKPLDVVEIPIIKYKPLPYQPENFLIDESERWIKRDTVTLKQVIKIHNLENYDVLLGNIYPYITEEKIKKVGRSLIIVKVTDLIIEHPKEKSTKATFIYNDIRYNNISVTDPDYYQVNCKLKKAILVMSLPSAPYNGNKYYKFIAKIFK